MKEILFNLSFDNWLAALLAFIPALLNCLILILSAPLIKRSFTSSVFFLFVFFLLMWQMEEVMMRLSASEATARMWSSLLGFGSQMVTAAGLHYLLLFSDRKKRGGRYLVIFGLYFPSIFFRVAAVNGISHFNFIAEEGIGWLYTPGDDLLSSLNSLWIAALAFATLFLATRNAWLQSDRQSLYFKQSRLIAIGAALPIFIGVGYEVVLPVFFRFNPYPISSSLSVTFSGAIFLALSRYALLEYSPKFIWTDMAKNTNDGILIVDNRDIIQYANEAFCAMIEYSEKELLGNIALELLRPDVSSKAKVIDANSRRKKFMIDKYEVKVLTKSGREITVEITGFPYVDREENVIGSVGIHKDITDKRNAEEEIRKREMRFRTILENNQDIIALADENFKILYRSPSAERITGFTMEERMRIGHDNSHPDDMEMLKAIVKEVIANPGKAISAAFRTRHKAGHYLWLEGTTTNMLNIQGVGAIVSNLRDVTERKVSEEKLSKAEAQVRNFAQHVHDLLEEERGSIARELHDELGQLLIGIKMGLSSFNKQPGLSSVTKARVSDMLLDVDGTVQAVKKMATNLRPAILDTLGLTASIDWLVSEFKKKSDIPCNYNSSVTSVFFDKKFSICFFRICQEAFTNIMKHSGATMVTVGLKQTENSISLKIEDNGKGIDPQKLENPFSLGLLGMRERANIISADLRITSSGKGTTIELAAKTD